MTSHQHHFERAVIERRVRFLRDDGDATHFLTVTLWDTEESIRGFAGDDLLTARYYPEDRDFLLEFEPRVQHFVVSAEARAASR
jgi:heme-degrading monooxygenase HmoA